MQAPDKNDLENRSDGSRYLEPDIVDKDLEATLAKSRRHEAEISALLNASRSVRKHAGSAGTKV